MEKSRDPSAGLDFPLLGTFAGDSVEFGLSSFITDLFIVSPKEEPLQQDHVYEFPNRNAILTGLSADARLTIALPSTTAGIEEKSTTL
jgi:hypothetical protein